MTVCGIVAEYNPFHSGHANHCKQIRTLLPDSAIISIMSGNYVQRGDVAIWEKYRRASLAVYSGGPDLVLELSLPAALSSAEHFAAAGVHQLQSTGLLTHLSFGSECGDVKLLSQAAQMADSEIFCATRQTYLNNGMGYAVASQSAMQQLCPECSPLFSSPNDTLGIQYIRALKNTDITVLAIPRIGAQHDGAPEQSVPSASWLRQTMQSRRDVNEYFLQDTSTWPRHFITEYQREIMAYLRRLRPEHWATISGISEGLEFRLSRAIHDSASLSEAIRNASSKRYPLSRIRRLVLCAYLGVTDELTALPPQYLRVLAFNDTGRTILKRMKERSALPVITKPLAAKPFTGAAKALWELDMLADDLYHHFSPSGSGWRQTAAYLSGTFHP